ncbi:MAG: alpha/beta fold hydrolase [Ilumatobacter sp.]
MSSIPEFGTTTTIRADGLPDEFRSVWTDLRNVSFSQGWIDANGVRTRYLRAGNPDAPKLVMLHGTGGHSEVFAPNLGPFSEHFDCWAIDFVGHGYTDKPDTPYDSFYTAQYLQDFMDAAGIDTADYIAISVSALHTLRLAQVAPDRVRRMVLVTPFGSPMPEEGDRLYNMWTDKERRKMGGRDDAAKAPTFDTAKKILSGVVADIDQIPDDMIAARFDVARQPNAPEAYQHVMWWAEHDIRIANTMTKEQLAEIPHPTLTFGGAGDPAFLPNATRTAESMPNAACVIVEGASHWANYEDPGSFNRIAGEFLTSTELGV